MSCECAISTPDGDNDNNEITIIIIFSNFIFSLYSSNDTNLAKS